MAVFLASHEADYIVAQTYNVDESVVELMHLTLENLAALPSVLKPNYDRSDYSRHVHIDWKFSLCPSSVVFASVNAG